MSWYVINHEGSVNFEDLFSQELILHIDESYRTWATKEFLDEEITIRPQENWDNALGTPFGEGLERNERLTDHYRDNTIIDIMETGNMEVLNTVAYYIDYGDDDFLIRGYMVFYITMLQNEINAEFMVRDGAHTWNYWRTSLPDVHQSASARFLG